MIVPLQDYTAKGFIWYQGCSNRINWYDYKELQVAFVKMLRQMWGNDEMPFYAVQLAPYTYEGDNLRSLPLVIEAQYQAMAELPHTGIAATTDIGNRTCIHPEKKKEVGDRLAWLALANDYGIKGLPASAPTYKSMERKDNKLVLSFNNLSNGSANEPNSIRGYYAHSYIQPKGFEIAGEDKVFHPARANVVWWQNKVEVWCDEVPNPVAVRYAFVNFPREANLETTYNMPFVPFRTDNWEIPAEEIGEIR
jgi:sialate O-acetylesterase